MIAALLMLAQVTPAVPMQISDVVAVGQSLDGKTVLVAGRLYPGCTVGSLSCYIESGESGAQYGNKLSIGVTKLEPQIAINRGKWVVLRVKVDRTCGATQNSYVITCLDRAAELTPIEIISVAK